MGESTHKIEKNGFKNGVSKNIIKNWILEGKGDHLRVREGGRRVLESEWNEIVKGKTIIESNIKSTADPKVLKLQEEVMYVWNELLSDKERSSVDVLRIKYTDEAKWKKSRKGLKRTLGTHASRIVLFEEKMLMSPSILTIHLAHNDQRNDVLNTVLHELSHARWAKEVEPNKEKLTKFTNKILEMGKANALTQYAGSFFDDLEYVTKKYKADIDSLNKSFSGTIILEDAKKTYEENIEKAKQLIANETHSEYFAMVSSPTNRDYHTVDKVKLKEMSKIIKEDLYE